MTATRTAGHTVLSILEHLLDGLPPAADPVPALLLLMPVRDDVQEVLRVLNALIDARMVAAKEELTLDELAAEVGVPKSTVRDAVRRGRAAGRTT